jgi:hypothetical protein
MPSLLMTEFNNHVIEEFHAKGGSTREHFENDFIPRRLPPDREFGKPA